MITFVIEIDMFFFLLAPNFAISIALQGLLVDHKIIPGNRISDALSIEMKKKSIQGKKM